MHSSLEASQKNSYFSFFRGRAWYGWLIAVVPIVAYFSAYGYYSQNLPRNDDPPATLPFLLAVHRGEPWGRILFEQYAEHRIVYVRLMTWLVQQLGGDLNYRILGLIGNLSLVGVLGVFWSWFRRWNLAACFLPVPFLIFHWGFHHNTFVAMMALQNLTIVCWAALVCWWLADGRSWRPYAALGIALVAVYTSGNGMLLLGIGWGYLLLIRHWKVLLCWVLVGGLAILNYFWGLRSMAEPEPAPDVLTQLGTMAAFGVMMSGSYFDLLPNVLKSSVNAGAPGWMSALLYGRLGICFVMGLLALAAATYVIFTRVRALIGHYWLKKRAAFNPESPLTFPVLLLLFVLGTVLVVAHGRYAQGLSQSFAVRYKIYSPILFSLLYAVAVYRLAAVRRQRYTVLVLILTAALAAWSYVQNLNQVLAQNRVTRAGLLNLQNNGVWLVSARYYGEIDPLLNGCIAAGLYRPGSELVSVFGALPVRADTVLPRWPVQIPHVDDYLTVISQQGGLETLRDDPAAGAYYVLLGSKNRYVTSTDQNRTGWGTYQPGFRAYVQVRGVDLVPGTYRLCVYLVNQGTRQLYDTGRVVRVPPAA